MECDPERVAQVLRILMDNALVHTPPGTAIRVSAERVNGEARLAVTDTGHGIKRKTLPHIFEPFFTASDDGSRGRRPRPGDRLRAGRAHGRRADRRVAPGRDDVHAGAAGVRVG